MMMRDEQFFYENAGLDSLVMSPAEVRARVVMALTEYDRKQQGKRGYNPYALAHYCRAAQDIEASMKADMADRGPRHWVLMTLCGKVADVALKAIGEGRATAEEKRKYGW